MADATLGPRPTTLIEAPRLSDRLGATVVLATETFQYTGSFKFRAAYNVAKSVPHPMIITASSGNFGQALALACRLMNKRCIVVMPENSARVKIEAVQSYGAATELVDTTKVTREARVAELAKQHPEAYVASAYDDPLDIDGNASLGYELARTPYAFDAIIVPVGGGGLSSGIVQGLRASGSQTPVFGAEPLLANDAAQSLRAGHVVVNESEPQSIADGARTRSLGKHNWAILREGLAGIIEVPEAQIIEAVRLLFALAHLKAEPTGALTTGALLADPRFTGQTVCLVVSGGNVDPALYGRILAGEI
ncbi:MAG TPA: threonine/serine dehydratase [Gemmatimonadaceae bacterium]